MCVSISPLSGTAQCVVQPETSEPQSYWPGWDWCLPWWEGVHWAHVSGAYLFTVNSCGDAVCSCRCGMCNIHFKEVWQGRCEKHELIRDGRTCRETLVKSVISDTSVGLFYRVQEKSRSREWCGEGAANRKQSDTLLSFLIKVPPTQRGEAKQITGPQLRILGGRDHQAALLPRCRPVLWSLLTARRAPHPPLWDQTLILSSHTTK